MIWLGLGFCLLCMAAGAQAASEHKIGVVTADGLSIRSEPGPHGALQKTLKRGTRIEILRQRKGWLQILHAGEVGFIPDQPQLVKIIRTRTTAMTRGKAKTLVKTQKQIAVYKKKAREAGHKIVAGRREVQKIARRETDIINKLDKVDQALSNARKRVAALESERAKIDRNILAANRSARDLTTRIKINEQHVADRLVALYKLKQLGRINILASAATINEFLQRELALARILSYDEKLRQKLLADRRRLEKVVAELQAHQAAKRLRTAALKKQIALLTAEKSKRAALLARIRSQKSLQLAALESLRKSASELNRRIKSLGIATPAKFSEKSAPAEPISAYKGLLNMPVKGKIIHFFGTYRNRRLNVLNFRSGIDIAAKSSAPVRAVYDGKIIYANWFKGYGNMIIIDHGANYYTLYAHLEKIFKTPQAAVRAGEVIGAAGDTGSIEGPKLHFEVRRHGKPLNPLDWLKIAKRSK